MNIVSTHVPETTPVPGPRKYTVVVLSDRPLAPREVRVLQRRWRVEPGLADLPVYAVTALADGGSCRPQALWIGGASWRRGDRQVPLSKSTTLSGLLVVQGAAVHVGAAGDEVCLSLEVRNEGYHTSAFHGAVLLGDWGELAADLRSYCQEGGPCQVPASGGACPGCNYPRAYANPASLLDAFLADQIYVRGTAMQIYPDPGIAPGLVQVVQLDGHLHEYPIPLVPEDQERSTVGDAPSPEESATNAPARASAPEILARHLLHASPRQLRAGLDSPAEILDLHAQARLLEHSAALMRYAASGRESGLLEDDPRDLALALAEGVVALSRGYAGHLSFRSLRTLERLAKEDRSIPCRNVTTIRPVAFEVRQILSELGHQGRAARVNSVSAECRIVVNDRRLLSHPWAEHAATGPFSGAATKIRIALLPGEADHVRIYDLQIVGSDYSDVRCSVLDHVPGYGPGLVREGPPAEVDGAFMSRYLPGTVFAGQLRGGVTLDSPYSLSPSDLSGGVLVDLGRPLPPLSRICLVYQVEPGHLFCGVVEPA